MSSQKKIKLEDGGAAAAPAVETPAYPATRSFHFPASLDKICGLSTDHSERKSKPFQCGGLWWMMCIETEQKTQSKAAPMQYTVDAFLFSLSVPIQPDHGCQWLDEPIVLQNVNGHWDPANGKAFGLDDGNGPADAVFFEDVTLELTTEAGTSIGRADVANYDPKTGFGCIYHSSATREALYYKGVGGRLLHSYQAKKSGDPGYDDNVILSVTFQDKPRPLRFV